MSKNYPLFSIIIPTYNSEDTIERVIKSIKKQSYPKKKIEILIVDGGSTDTTLLIAKKYYCRIINNPKMHQVFAKHLGYLKSKGKFITHLDSDEVLENKNSLKLKYEIFQKNKNVRAVVVSGYKTPKGFSSANNIVNEYGDTFSHFLYHNSTTYGFYEKMAKKYGKTIYEDDNCLILDHKRAGPLPLIELSVMGYTLDKKYLKKNFPELNKKPFLISHLYYMIVNEGGYIGFAKKDPVIHYSTASFTRFFKKIRSRVINNVYKTEMGKSAFSGRDKYYPLLFHYKKYLYIPYTLSLVFPFIDGAYLAITRRKAVFLLHPILCLHVLVLIIYFYFLKLLGIKPEMKAWGV